MVSFPEGFGVDAELAAVAERYVRELRAAGADAVVAINHIGLPLDKKLAAEARGIDVIVGGHTHDAVEEKIIIDNGANSTLVGQAGLDGRYAGRFDVTVDEGGLVAEKSSWTLLRVTPETRGVPEVEAMGRAAQREIAAALKISNPIMGLTRAVDCTRTAARTRENEFGNLAAEAFRYSANARIGFINGGSLRIGRVVPPGPFSSTDMLDLIPYGDKLRRLLMTGAQIREQLEISASSLVAPGEEYDYARRTHSGEFLHVAGLRFEIDLDGEAAEVVNRRMTRAGSRVQERDGRERARLGAARRRSGLLRRGVGLPLPRVRLHKERRDAAQRDRGLRRLLRRGARTALRAEARRQDKDNGRRKIAEARRTDEGENARSAGTNSVSALRFLYGRKITAIL